MKVRVMAPRGQVVLLLSGIVMVVRGYKEEPNMLTSDMLKEPTYDDIIQYNANNPHSNPWERQRTKRQAIKGTSRKTDVTLTNKDDVFHGPEVEVPDISFRDMASFVNEAQKTIEDRFENLEREIYKSRARQVPGSPEWFMAASTKTKVVAKNISLVALVSEEATKYLAQKYQLTRQVPAEEPAEQTATATTCATHPPTPPRSPRHYWKCHIF